MSDNRVILTESALDVPASIRKELGIEIYKVPVYLNDEEYDYNVEIDDGFVDFYQKLKNGASVKTAAVSPYGYREILEPYMKAGKDVIYVAYSGKISGALNYFMTTANELMKEYPQRKIVLADTLNLSYGGGILVVESAKMLKEGKSLEEIKAFVENEREKVSLFFTPETLTYLRRGGRLSGAKAVIGNLLNVKPILYVGNNGVLEQATKVNGRKKSLITIIELMQKITNKFDDKDVYVLHSFAEDDAKIFADMIKDKLGPKSISILSIGPVIGAHCGPGTIGVGFIGGKREYN